MLARTAACRAKIGASTARSTVVRIASFLGRRRNQKGSSASEYALIMTVVSVCILASVSFFGARTGALFQESCESVAATQQSGC
jgi:Flp pilus assembly pilin Flp